MTYRTIYLVIYLSKNILYRKLRKFIKLLIIDFVSVAISLLVTAFVPKLHGNYLQWGWSALQNALVSMIIFFAIYYFLYKKELLKAIKMFVA